PVAQIAVHLSSMHSRAHSHEKDATVPRHHPAPGKGISWGTPPIPHPERALAHNVEHFSGFAVYHSDVADKGRYHRGAFGTTLTPLAGHSWPRGHPARRLCARV